MRPHHVWPLLKQTLTEWMDDNVPAQAAALAYYTLFSVAPMLIIAIAVAGLAFGQEAAHGEIRNQLQSLIGDAGAKVVEDLVASASKPSSGIVATLIGVLVSAFAATGVFVQLQDSLNTIWKVKKKPMNGLLAFVRQRLLSFAMVLGIGFLLLVSLVVSAALAAAGTFLKNLMPGWEAVMQLVNLAIAFSVTTVLFAMIYKVMPDTHVAWRDVWLGAAVTSFLFSLGKLGIGMYLGKSSVSSSYGAAGSFAVLLLWVYYSSQLLFLGAEFTQVYSRWHGSRRAERPAAQVT
ncbi:YihY/virulence factor BrkB family protein [Corallococcus praedator]|uniref:YihY/virulence factor BrkB family protein n=1 Tax=Corallococcus praedator TaxID=2316724 RepID=A0ABX9QTP9_9BACT|nr:MULTISPECIES: YihY/virulence factor BrkB family protein [Corallococcus]RKH05340.1 YihY/virulence factor BrkB family protein [Corallococcus sp. CA047B]RKH36579.1 YihY/virulence factor BrkB family protein [Corallococcus sp. CA031C]RKI17709.1 YihY/virulence factor BrkB family protein [Corallococcus praedator]